jgi:hypothetical protein
VSWVFGAKARGYKDLNFLARQFLLLVSKEQSGLLVGEDNASFLVYDDHGIRRRFQYRSERRRDPARCSL